MAETRTVSRWNEEKGSYSFHTVPAGWKIRTYCNDLDEEVNCVCCGRPIKFGDGYSSRVFHTSAGFGYCECETCYNSH